MVPNTPLPKTGGYQSGVETQRRPIKLGVSDPCSRSPWSHASEGISLLSLQTHILPKFQTNLLPPWTEASHLETNTWHLLHSSYRNPFICQSVSKQSLQPCNSVTINNTLHYSEFDSFLMITNCLSQIRSALYLCITKSTVKCQSPQTKRKKRENSPPFLHDINRKLH